jgi:hypothetical protein
MTQKVTLPKDARLFVNHRGRMLSNEQESAIAGTEFEVHDTQLMHYDHRDQMAIKVLTEKGDRWILIQESGIMMDA